MVYSSSGQLGFCQDLPSTEIQNLERLSWRHSFVDRLDNEFGRKVAV
jgi:hypothetical protein